ncbi:MAG TPA: peptidase T [Candidatus Coprenecus stercoravium]|uniref:Peptidase T n=1 Tax=Candidatus Coprenecus stercoravium TaxID=2840735 RepID=A0A9D2K9E5_9BACT|nr:peptidase T [Candidatus Coprenecus stercoravium]
MEKIIDRFLRYVAFDTTSNPDSQSQPSTNKQFALLDQLRKELTAMGVEQVDLDKNGYLMASIPSNIEEAVPAIGFISHVDTSPDAPGCGIKPRIIENYDGKTIVLNEDRGIELDPKEFPELRDYVGQTLITTDGNTLLGADDKAGVAEIMSAVEYIMEHPEFRHGEIKIGFTPDEEIGRGVDRFDVKKFGAQYAYTMDGGAIGELEYENFNAASAKIHIQGRNIHPGYAKDKMLNAILIGSELNDMLPVWQRPEYTEGYDGFFHIHKFSGVVEEAEMQYIIRDHDTALFERKKEMLRECADFINRKYGEGVVTLEIKDQYYNMKKQVEPHYHIIEIAVKAMQEAGIKANIRPIRGGTDGARLSFMGLPCPNIFAGGLNFHGKYEYVPLQSMEKATEVILNIIKNFASK